MELVERGISSRLCDACSGKDIIDERGADQWCRAVAWGVAGAFCVPEDGEKHDEESEELHREDVGSAEPEDEDDSAELAGVSGMPESSKSFRPSSRC